MLEIILLLNYHHLLSVRLPSARLHHLLSVPPLGHFSWLVSVIVPELCTHEWHSTKTQVESGTKGLPNIQHPHPNLLNVTGAGTRSVFVSAAIYLSTVI